MGSFSTFHWIVVLVIVLLLFGAGKIPRLMGDLAKGVKAFKAGLKDDDTAGGPAATPGPDGKVIAGGTVQPHVVDDKDPVTKP